MARSRVLIADDLAPVLETIRALLLENYDVVGTAVDGHSALAASFQYKPELTILDISMPGMSGIEVATELRRRGDLSKIVFLTVHEDLDIVNACHDAGGLGYVIKVRMDSDLIPAMEAALDGRSFCSRFSDEQNSR
jgi:DNA-binding NarL/FixJ family response regulator